MKKYPIGIAISLCAVAVSSGTAYMLIAGTVKTPEDLYELASTHPDRALANVSQVIQANPELTNHCHEITHQIGHLAYASLKERAFDFVKPLSLCGAGYLHGLLEKAVTFDDGISLNDKVHQVCKENQIESCLHGLGHAILNATHDIPTAVQLCTTITSEHTDCYDGVFMEQFDSESSPVHMSYADGASICLTLDPAVQPSCFFYLPRTAKDVPAAEVAVLCSALEGPARSACAQGSGVMFMKYERIFDKDSALSMCDAYADQSLQQPCVHGVENYSQFGSVENSKWQ